MRTIFIAFTHVDLDILTLSFEQNQVLEGIDITILLNQMQNSMLRFSY